MSFNWCFIGCGKLANTVAQQMKKHRGHKIISCYTRNFDKCREFGEKHGATPYENARDAILADGVDGVYIVTPHNAHHRFAKLALELGRPVLCEKAFTVTAEETEELISLAKEKNLYLCEAMWTWFSDTALTVKKWVQSGEIGQVKKVEIHHCFPGMSMKADSRVRDPMTAGGALLDIGIYPITYCYNIFGYPDKIRCEGTIEQGIDTKEKVILTYGSLDCELYMSLYYPKEKCVIKGSKGSVRLPGVFHAAPMAVLMKKIPVKLGFGKTTYLNEFDRCVQEIRNGKTESEYIPFEATLSTMKIMDECRKQMGLIYPFEK